MKISTIRIAAVFLAVICAAAPFSDAQARRWDHDDGWHGRGHGHDYWGGGYGRGHGRGHSNNVVIYQPYPAYQRDVVVVNQPPHYIGGYNNYAPVSTVRCSNSYNPAGAIIGGVSGGLIGTQIGKGHGRDVAMIGGAILGGLLGNSAGASYQQNCTSEVISAPVGTQVVWNDGYNNNYGVTPTRDFRQDGRYCREYQGMATVGGRTQQTYGTACMQPDGSWEIVN